MKKRNEKRAKGIPAAWACDRCLEVPPDGVVTGYDPLLMDLRGLTVITSLCRRCWLLRSNAWRCKL